MSQIEQLRLRRQQKLEELRKLNPDASINDLRESTGLNRVKFVEEN